MKAYYYFMNRLLEFFGFVRRFDESSRKSWVAYLYDCMIIIFAYSVVLYRLRFIRLRKNEHKFSVHTLLSHCDLPFYIICVYSFLRYLKQVPKFTIYDDGTLTERDYRILTKIPRARIVHSMEARRLAIKTFGPKSDLVKRRADNPYDRKLIDVALYKVAGKKILLLDSDVLFFQYPKELLAFLENHTTQTGMTYIQDIQNAYIATIEKLKEIFETTCPVGLNSGVLAFRSEILTSKFATNYYHMISVRLNNAIIFKPWVEQTGYAVLASRTKSRPLSKNYVIGRPLNRQTVCKHYVHGMRHDYANDLLRLFSLF